VVLHHDFPGVQSVSPIPIREARINGNKSISLIMRRFAAVTLVSFLILPAWSELAARIFSVPPTPKNFGFSPQRAVQKNVAPPLSASSFYQAVAIQHRMNDGFGGYLNPHFLHLLFSFFRIRWVGRNVRQRSHGVCVCTIRPMWQTFPSLETCRPKSQTIV
jgi:hypothetical protein